MEKNIRILGKVVLVILCTLCFIFLIHKDKTVFQLKQPAGEKISKEDVLILLETATEVMEEENAVVKEAIRTWVLSVKQELQTEELLYEEYQQLLNIWKSEKETWYEEYTYQKKYRDTFYVVRKDWYQFYDAFLMHYGLEEKIQKKEITILAGKDNLTEETIGKKHLLTRQGEVIAYRSAAFEDCFFSTVTAYVQQKDKEDERVLLTVVSKQNDKFTLENVWVMEVFAQQDKIQFFYQGYEIVSALGKEKDNSRLLREMVSDITFQNGIIVKMEQKMHRVSGRLLRMDELELELEGSGVYPISESIKVYQLYDSLRECGLHDLRIGYDFADFVLEDGKVCGALIMRKENMENIRVAIKTDGFASLYHEELSFFADCDMELVYGTYEERKKKVIPAGEEILITKDSEYLEGARAELLPTIQSGKIQVNSLCRNQGTPIYRGTFEIAKSENGLILINELLLEEYLYSVVPSEMPASYPQEALKAQAICARTYAYRYLIQPGLANLGAHVDDSVSYQVYNNIAENSNSTKAVKETMGELLFHEGEMVSTYYYSTSCGFGSDAGVWQEENKESMPYLVSKHISTKLDEVFAEDMTEEETVREYLLSGNENDYEFSEPWYRWEYTVNELEAERLSERLQARYKAAADKVLTLIQEDVYESREPASFTKVYDILILKRRAGGVIDELLLKTNKGDYKVISEYNVRYLLNDGGSIKKQDGNESVNGQLLPSAYLVLEVEKKEETVTGYKIIGGGYGHGVGLSQNGAKAMGIQGKNCQDILYFFYENCKIKKMY